MGNIRRVKIADFAVLKKEGLLITIGLGSCVGIAMFDPVARVAGLAHILLADSSQFAKRDNLAKFADTAVPLTLEKMTSLGARHERIKAKIAGGSQLFSFKQNGESVGKRNVAAVMR
ncbi:MAG TPA: chemotaxis protein CheD, partial [Firmicutes bacterium]|nr:chemotaxis protein CheD [Bacillota bacterium]